MPGIKYQAERIHSPFQPYDIGVCPPTFSDTSGIPTLSTQLEWGDLQTSVPK